MEEYIDRANAGKYLLHWLFDFVAVQGIRKGYQLLVIPA